MSSGSRKFEPEVHEAALVCLGGCAARRHSKSIRLLSQLRNNEHGATLLETALTLTIFISLLLGAIEFSFAFFAYQNIADAARQASRWAAVRGSTSCSNVPGLTGCNAGPTQVKSFVQGLSYAGIVSSNVTVNTTWLQESTSTPGTWTACATTCNDPGNQVQVNVSYQFPIAIPFWKATTFNISSTGSMVISQ